jgi:predicted GNAT superfamily acetyltransferase
MFLYTFIMDYEGGTYVSQFQGESVKDACIEWSNNLDVSEIESFSEANKSEFIKEMKDEIPTPIDRLINVWCISLLTEDDKLAIVDIVQTEKTDNRPPTTDN